MRLNNVTSLVILTFSFLTNSKTLASPDPDFHIYLALGQSNMEGQGPVQEEDRTVDQRFKMLSTVDGCHNRTMGEWYDAIPPLAHCNSKMGPVDYFGRAMVKNLPEKIKIGVVVVAIGGCGVGLFEPDNNYYYVPSWMQTIVDMYNGNPYEHLVEMGKKAQEAGVIKGILYHQGEANVGEITWPGRVKNLYENLLRDLNLKAEDVPFLVGEVVDSDMNGQCGRHNLLIQQLPEIIPTAHVISSKGLEHTGDRLHFTYEAYHILGERYADEMLKILSERDDQQDESCWSSILSYSCCVNTTNIIYSDENGDWGVENNEWCGINKTENTSTSCWAVPLGYDCCSLNSCRNIYYTDDDGQWDIENGNWCGITFENLIC
ncbi:family 6 carbohydrate esterase [Piromyces sp. E2]|nr:family 6 carbohydrate esterase [Piromyces sp. E2]|eukprot:OUM57834.1 family 6 carbohydrate esterase [Piromyces sp. E2]